MSIPYTTNVIYRESGGHCGILLYPSQFVFEIDVWWTGGGNAGIPVLSAYGVYVSSSECVLKMDDLPVYDRTLVRHGHAKFHICEEYTLSIRRYRELYVCTPIQSTNVTISYRYWNFDLYIPSKL